MTQQTSTHMEPQTAAGNIPGSDEVPEIDHADPIHNTPREASFPELSPSYDSLVRRESVKRLNRMLFTMVKASETDEHEFLSPNQNDANDFATSGLYTADDFPTSGLVDADDIQASCHKETEDCSSSGLKKGDNMKSASVRTAGFCNSVSTHDGPKDPSIRAERKKTKSNGRKTKRSEDSDSSMRKDNTWNVSVNTDRPILEDDAHLKVSYTPGKKGGNFGLPLGAKLMVPDGVFNKKDSITCEVAPPAQRWKFTPVLPVYEHLTSEIFQFSSTVAILKKAVVIQIPFYAIDTEHSEINVKGKWKDEHEWVNVGFLKKDGNKAPCVELEIDRLGIFVVTFTPKKEVFEVTTQGCLYNSRLSKYISIRFPKKTSDKNFQCTIQINPISPEKVQLAKQNFPHETNELLETSEFIDVLPEFPVTFKRPVTVKLPLPARFEESEEKKTDDIAVLQKTEKGWIFLDSAYKFTKTTVTFDVKTLSTFCVALSKPERKTALHRSITVLEGRLSKEMGEILVFISLQEKCWIILLELCSISRKESKVSERKDKGFSLIDKSVIQKEDNVKPSGVPSRRPPPVSIKSKTPEVNGFEIFDGMRWGFDIKDDIRCSFDSDYMENKDLQFFKYLPESYRRFVIEPKNNEEKDLFGVVTFSPYETPGQEAKFASPMKFSVDIPEDTVRAYFKPEYVPEEPKPEKEKPKFNFDLALNKEEKKDEPFIPKFKPIPPTVMERLMRTSRKPIILEKESRILSGKSLMTISRLVPEGLTLAVHLDLPDSTITGLGFDAISNGLGMVDVTYKILLYWKRQQKDKKDGAVNVLSMALRDMGRGDIATVIQEKHRENKDVTLECFAQS